MGIFKKQKSKPTSGRTGASASQDPLDRVLPAVRTLTSIQQQQLRLQMQGGAVPDFPTRPLAGNLRVALVENFDEAVAYVDERRLQEWGTSFDQLLPRAISNLEKYDPGGLSARQAGIDGGFCFSFFATDDFLGSRLLTPGHLNRMPLPDLMVVINPDRNVLVMADANNSATVLQAFDDAMRFADSPGFVSLRPLVGDGTNWQELELREGHPAKSGLHNLHVQDRMLQANAVGPELQGLVDQNFFVQAMLVREEAGRVDSAIGWPEGHPSLLAEADTIAFVPADQTRPVLYASWAAAMQTVGMLMTPSAIEPSRWQVTAFPSPEQFQQMGARPLPSDSP